MIRAIFSFRHLLTLLFYVLCCMILITVILWFLSFHYEQIHSYLLPLLSTVLFIMLAAGIIISYFVLKRRAEKLSEGLRSIASDEWQKWEVMSQQIRTTRYFDLMRQIAMVLRGKNETIARQQAERLALLSSMVEGVLAVDNSERVLIINRAAEEIFGVQGEKAAGKMLPEVIRSIAVQRIIAQVLAAGKTVEDEIAVLGEEERKLLAHGSPLRDAGGEQIGVIVVFNDITKLEKYERIRRDFVANVSHELKTPITTIKGFVETLRSRKPPAPADSAHFLQIIAEETDRMNAIVNDLLELTTVEHDEESNGIELAPQLLRPVAEASIAELAPKAQEHGITLELASPMELSAPANAVMLEQALINLLDNAINYSEPGRTVWVEITADESHARIAVRDQGIGIDKRFIPRLTERFFRVDKSRSRKQGGTGLGLAIVNHIVKAHHGELTIDSEPGVGSTFTVVIPLAASNPN